MHLDVPPIRKPFFFFFTLLHGPGDAIHTTFPIQDGQFPPSAILAVQLPWTFLHRSFEELAHHFRLLHFFHLSILQGVVQLHPRGAATKMRLDVTFRINPDLLFQGKVVVTLYSPLPGLSMILNIIIYTIDSRTDGSQ